MAMLLNINKGGVCFEGKTVENNSHKPMVSMHVHNNIRVVGDRYRCIWDGISCQRI